MADGGSQSQAAGGFSGDFWMANSRYAYSELFWSDGNALDGGEVIVKPPAWGMVGT